MMDPIEESLRSVRHVSMPTTSTLELIIDRGHRRVRQRRLATAISGICMVLLAAGTALALADRPSRKSQVLTSGSATSPTAGEVVLGAIPWYSARVGPDDHTLTLSYSAGSPQSSDPCYQPVRARFEETSESVTVTLDVYSASESRATPPSCELRLYTRNETVELRVPLGQRTLIDGSSGEVRPVSR